LVRGAPDRPSGLAFRSRFGLLERRNVVVPEVLKEHVLRWLDAWRDGVVESIGDALIAASMSAHSAEAIVTFDRGFPPGDWAS